MKSAQPDSRLIVQALVHLHIARRTLRIYPITHEQVKRSVVRAYKSLAGILKVQKSLALIVLKDAFGIGDRILEAKNAMPADLAGDLRSYGIAGLTFKGGMDINELVRFLQLVSMEHEVITAKGGIAAAARERKLASIELQVMDYSKLHLTEEQEIRREEDPSQEGKSVWQQFVSQLVSNRTDQEGSQRASLDPGRLADLLNRKALDAGKAIGSFQSAFASETGTSSVEALSAFKDLIERLNPELKKQFLSVTYDHCDRVEASANAARLVEGLGAELILQMLGQASSEGRKISPSLLAFIKKMGPVGALLDGEMGSEQGGLSAAKVQSLLNHEQYDTYVDDEYSKLLGQLTGAAQPADGDRAVRSIAQEIEEDLTAAQINAHVGRAITRLMTRSEHITGYRDWARQLTYLLDDLLESRAYAYLNQVIDFVRQEQKHDDKARAEIARLMLGRFHDPQFVAMALEAVEASMNESDPDALTFLMEIGEPVIVEIFDGLDPKETLLEKGVLTQVLRNLASVTAQEAIERLDDPRSDYVQRLIRIIGKIGSEENVQQIRTLLDHTDMSVRMEALATLLQHDNKWGLMRLKELLADTTDEAFARAAAVAGQHRVRSVVPQLISIAEQRGEPEPIEAAIKALGRIGDPQAIPVLKKIVHRRWSMAKKQTLYMKRIVYENLDGYSNEAIHDLLHFGLKQKDPEIRSASERLLRRGDGSTRGRDAGSDDA